MLYISLHFPFIMVFIVGIMPLLSYCNCIIDVVEAENCLFSHGYLPKGSPNRKTEHHIESLDFELDSAIGWAFEFLPWSRVFSCGKKNEIFQ